MRKREFSQLRKRSCSSSERSFTQRSEHQSQSQFYSQFYTDTASRNNKNQYQHQNSNYQQDCVNCVNHKLKDQKRSSIKLQKQKEVKDQQDRIRYLNSLRDLAEQRRQKMKTQANLHNKSMLEQKLHQKFAQSQQNFEDLLKIISKQQQQRSQQDQFEQSRKHLTESYNQALRHQLLQERKQKKISKQLQRSNSQGTKFKLIQNHEQYLKKVILQRKKCSQQIQRQIIQNSIQKLQAKRQKIQKEKQCIQLAQKNFQNFTQFHKSSPYDLSRTYVNPQTYEQVKVNIQKRKNDKKAQLQNKNQERVEVLRKQSEQNRLLMEKKMKAMKNYISMLKSQVLQKEKKKQKQIQEKLRPVQKSRTDYYTQEVLAESRLIKPCGSCHKNYDSKYLSSSLSLSLPVGQNNFGHVSSAQCSSNNLNLNLNDKNNNSYNFVGTNFQ